MPESDLSAYQGRWVALADQTVVGVGETPDDALRLAKRNRPKDRFRVQFVEQSEGTPLQLPELLVQLRPFFLKQSQPIYLVGGAVRDILLGKPVHDLDFVVPRGAIRLSLKTGDAFGWPAYILDKERDTGRVVIAEQDTTLDFAKFRGANLEEDLKDRDFTINALALPATAQFKESVIDFTQGIQALDDKIIQLANPDALKNDPVRAIRAIRQSHSLSLEIEPTTQQKIKEAVGLLSQPSGERIRDEWLKVLSIQNPTLAIRQLHSFGLLKAILPELAQRLDEHEDALPIFSKAIQIEHFIFEEKKDSELEATIQQTLKPFATHLKSFWQREIDGGLNGRILLRTLALILDNNQAESAHATSEKFEERFRALAFSNQAINHIIKGIRHQNRLHKLLDQVTDQPFTSRHIYRYYLDLENEGIDVLIITLATLLLWDNKSSNNNDLKVIAGLLEGRFDRYEQVINPPILINGRDLIKQFNLQPGPEIGRILRLIKEEQAAGGIHTLEEALSFASSALN